MVSRIGSAVKAGWNALTENPQVRQKREWEKKMTAQHGRSGNYDGKWNFGETNLMPAATQQQSVGGQPPQQPPQPQAPPVGGRPIIQASNDRAFDTGWAVVKDHPHGTDPKTGKGKVGTWKCNRCGLPQGPSRNRACANPECTASGGG